MKIFFVNTNKHWGGGEKWHLETACYLKDMGHDVTILALPGKDLYIKSISAGIQTIPVRVTNLSFLNPFRLMAIIRLLRKEKPEIIILNFSADIKTVGMAARYARIRNIVYRRGSAIPIRNTWFNRFLFRKVITRIIANSKETKHTILQNNSNLFPEDAIRVIYNGINITRFDDIPIEVLYKRKDNEVIIGNAGRLSHEKGQKYLIELAAILEKHKIRFRILIAGEGVLESTLRVMARQTGVEEQVIFLGFVNNMKAFMENIDIFVLPSQWEGFGYVSIEAMACEKPVVAFDIGSNPEIVVDGNTGFLARHFDINDLAQKVESLIRDPDLRKSFGLAGRRRVQEVFDQARAEKEIELYLTSLQVSTSV